MKLRGSLLVIAYCLVVEFWDINHKQYLILASGDLINAKSVITMLGLLFMLYPLVGHLTDVYLPRYRSLKWSFLQPVWVLHVSMRASHCNVNHETMYVFQPSYPYLYVAAFIIYIVYIIGLGLFQANAIQFGLDQLLEAPT